jgi:predicted GH43/DUF377 family glycosyl hydrolase
MKITKSPIRLYASPKAVITQFLNLPGTGRVSNIIRRVKDLPAKTVATCLEKTMQDFASRHRDIQSTFRHHFNKVEVHYKDLVHLFSEEQQLLLGSYLTKEYSIQAAALFNPSIVPHPQQKGLQPGQQRFVMSLRATGEGHISSIVFQTGIAAENGDILLDPPSRYFTSLAKNDTAEYDKDFLTKRSAFFKGSQTELLDMLPARSTASQAYQTAENIQTKDAVLAFHEILDTNYELRSSPHLPLNERVIFPNAKAESMGMEDIRFVKFEDATYSCYYGTYTAYDGHNIKSQLIETQDFDVFKIRTLYGSAISDKGMALFPEKVNGKYAMISRQGGENISIMFSDDLYVWNQFQLLMEPKYPWEFVQLGNCGSPVKTSKGWLLLTHGVGPLRTYVISAILLDMHDPSVIIGRLDTPFIEANEKEREGYVPNVVYTCGSLLHGDILIIPYAVSDSATGFVTVNLNDLLNELLST